MVLLRFLLADVLSVVVVLGLLGVAAILTGALRFSGALHDDPVVGDRCTPLSRILGVLEIALGAVLIGTPRPTRATAVAVGLWSLAAGAILLSHALAIWRANRRARHALSARSE